MTARPAVEVALLRHGPTDWNREGRLQGRADRPLTPEARAELARLAAPEPWGAARWLASPLTRARDTAALLAGQAPELEPRLTEMDFGGWEGARGADLIAAPGSGFRPVERWGWAFRAPQGEGPADLRARLAPLFAELSRDGRRAVLVCHINVMRVALALAHDWAFEGPAPFRVKRRRLYPLALDPEGRPRMAGPEIRLTARDAALQGEASP